MRPRTANEFQQAQAEWADQTFSARPPTGPLKHLYLLLMNGAYLLGYSASQVQGFAEDKHAINAKRVWGKVDKDGVARHIKEPEVSKPMRHEASCSLPISGNCGCAWDI